MSDCMKARRLKDTMEKGKTSRTAEAAAAQRAIHQLFDDEPKILVDPIAPKIVDVDGDPYKFAVAARDHPNMKLLRSNMVLRSRYTEDCLAEAVQRRVRQYLILGAGLILSPTGNRHGVGRCTFSRWIIL